MIEAVKHMDEATLAAEILRLNTLYREGRPEVEDVVYDSVYLARLRELNPDHPVLSQVEAETVGTLGAPVRHSSPLLSTDKAYDDKAVEAWVSRAQKAAGEIGIATVTVRITPKLDGLAAHWNGKVLATRGDGTFGQDVTRNIARGLVLDRELDGPGEIVIVQDYFEEYIREQFDMKHPRNFMVGLIGADTLGAHHTQALADGQCRFVSYQTVETVSMPIGELSARWKQTLEQLRATCPYLTDGAVVEIENDRLRDTLGATSHHHRWMLALKTAGEVAQTTVKEVVMQTGRTGRVSPVLEVEDTPLSGAVIRRCTAHTARHVLRLGLGKGARITLVRSGEVIPTLLSVEERSKEPVDMSRCPSCGEATEWDNDYLVCPNAALCPAQASARLEHFFKRMGINGFGPRICEQLVKAGVTDPVLASAMSMREFALTGISMGVAANLAAAIVTRQTQVILDKDAVAAFSVRHCGRGDSRKILAVHPWQTLGDVTAADIEKIPGFGRLTAELIAPHLARVCEGLHKLAAQGFKFEATLREADIGDSPIKGKKVVFTGTMPMPRDAMEQRARELGATVQSGVSTTTDLLIYGEKAGSKLEKAKALGVNALPVSDYFGLVGAA